MRVVSFEQHCCKRTYDHSLLDLLTVFLHNLQPHSRLPSTNHPNPLTRVLISKLSRQFQRTRPHALAPAAAPPSSAVLLLPPDLRLPHSRLNGAVSLCRTTLPNMWGVVSSEASSIRCVTRSSPSVTCRGSRSRSRDSNSTNSSRDSRGGSSRTAAEQQAATAAKGRLVLVPEQPCDQSKLACDQSTLVQHRDTAIHQTAKEDVCARKSSCRRTVRVLGCS